MQKVIHLFACLSFVSALSAQYHLDVEGNAMIRGKLDLGHQYDTTSIYLGRASAEHMDTAGYVTNRLNTVLGWRASRNCIGGTFNTVVGSRAGSHIQGSSNAFFGADAGRNAVGANNSFFGSNAGTSTVDGAQNSFFGVSSGLGNTGGSANAFYGAYTGSQNANADLNTYLGFSAGQFNSGDTSSLNTFVGAYAGRVKIGGKENVLVGGESGSRNRVGDFNTLIGVRAGAGDNSTRMDYCTFIGYESGANHQAGPSTFVGSFSGTNNTLGLQNTFIGTSSGFDNTEGNENTFVGYTSGFKNSSGHRNTFIGANTGRGISTGSDNICLGRNSGPTTNASNRLYVDVLQTDEPLIFGDFDTDQLTIYGNLSTVEDQAVLKMKTKSHPNGSVLVLQSDATTPSDIGAINFNNDLDQTTGQIAYNVNNEMDFRVDGIDPFMVLSNQGDHISMSNGATLTSGGVWTNNCSGALKKLNARLDTELMLQQVVDLPLYDWSYKRNGERHAGPTAEDFYESFGLGNSSKTLASVDMGGVALAAIQELASLNKQLVDEIFALKKKLANLESRIIDNQSIE